MAPGHRKTTLLQSFNHAFEGLVHAVRYQRNMRIHLSIAVVVLVASILLNLTKLELIAILASITFVLVTELLNSAIEAVVDIVTDEFDPRAKIAKDVAAGAVLVAAVNSLVVAYLVLTEPLSNLSLDLVTAIRESSTHLTIVAFVLVMVAVIAVKAASRKGTPLSGGLPSGHAALAFAGWTAVTFMVEGLLVSVIVLLVAVLVAQSRIEAGIHSFLEVALGALLGIVVTTLVFQLWF